jgi:uncharacterized membrane protein
LVVVLTPLVVATAIGIVALWPNGTDLALPTAGTLPETYSALVVAVEREPCTQPGQEEFECAVAEVELKEGPDENTSISLNLAEGLSARHIGVGDRILVGRSTQPEATTAYFFVDYERSGPLVVLVILFAAVVIALSRMRGLYSLIGLAASLGILIMFVLPAILEGSDPVLVALVGGAAIMLVSLYLAHGFNAMTTTAVLGTFGALAITGVLAVIFVEAFQFTGFGSEETVFLQISATQINLEGLLLGSIVIGTLGVLDDVTVTQASAVWELHAADPYLGSRGLYRAGIRIGRDHIASTVNTLVLAYAGAALPLLILFTLAERSFGSVVTSEVVAEEIVRTLVGSIGLVASVPLTTALASMVAAGDRGPRLLDRPGTRPKRERDRSRVTGEDQEARAPEPVVEDPLPGDEDFKRPRGEDFFRSD